MSTSDSDNVPSERRMAETLAGTELNNELRYLASGSQTGWMEWNGQIWQPCQGKLPHPLLAAVREQTARWLRASRICVVDAKNLEKTSALGGILNQLTAYPEMRMPPDEVDPVDLLVLPKGVLDMKTWEVHPHCPSRFVTKSTSQNPEPGSPLWDLVVDHLRASHGGHHAAVQRYLGMGLFGRPPDRKCLWLYGTGGTGKSTLIKILSGSLGTYAAPVAAEVLAAGHGGAGAHGHELSHALVGVRLAVASEVPGKLNWPLLKAMTGGDLRPTKRAYGKAFNAIQTGSLLIASNEKPEIPRKDQAAADRIALLEMKQPAEDITHLHHVISTPGPERDQLYAAALHWLIEGARDFKKCGEHGLEGMIAPGVHMEPIEKWYEDSKAHHRFDISSGWTSFVDLLHDHQSWCSLMGEHDISDSAQLGNFLRREGIQRRRTGAMKKTEYNMRIIRTPDTIPQPVNVLMVPHGA